MKTLNIRDKFRCAILEPERPEDLSVYFTAKYNSYADDNPDIPQENKYKTLRAMQGEDTEYFSDMFKDENIRIFVILDDEGQIIGSADLMHIETRSLAYLCSSHIHSDYRGQRLVDMLFEAREEYVRTQTEFTRMHLQTEPKNQASQKAAKRNGFQMIERDDHSGVLTFEKTL